MKHLATWIEKNGGQHFEELFKNSDFRVWDARLEDDIPWLEVGGLLLTGGSDVSADFLCQPVTDSTLIRKPEPARDKWDFSALRQALARGLPILAICRGHQVLNVALGGTLRLDIPDHNLPEQKYGNVQELRHDARTEIRFERVNSSHHQAIDRLGEGLEVEAWHVGDDVIEQVRLTNYPFCLGAQYHPERDVLYRPLFDAFLAQVS